MNAAVPRPKTLEEVKQSLRERLKVRNNPLRFCDQTEAAAAIERLESLDDDHWGTVWGAVGDAFGQSAEKAEKQGDTDAAAKTHFQAYAFYYVGRYPCPNSPKKKECARQAREHYIAASRSFDPPLEKIAIPFAGRPGEGKEIVFYLRKPRGVAQPPVVVIWGGVDGFKEERYENDNAILAAGIATVAMDMPGTGESPVYGSTDAERQFQPVLEWVQKRQDLDGSRIGVLGSSFGGYWATKVAHVYRKYLKAAVNWGGGSHYFTRADWLIKARYPDGALNDLGGTRAHAFNYSSYEEFVAFAPRLSLLDQGVLDQPCAPLLVVNGKKDTFTPIEDTYLLLEHGDPKNVRIFPGGHMGKTPATLPTIVNWLADRLVNHNALNKPNNTGAGAIL